MTKHTFTISTSTYCSHHLSCPTHLSGHDHCRQHLDRRVLRAARSRTNHVEPCGPGGEGWAHPGAGWGWLEFTFKVGLICTEMFINIYYIRKFRSKNVQKCLNLPHNYLVYKEFAAHIWPGELAAKLLGGHLKLLKLPK